MNDRPEGGDVRLGCRVLVISTRISSSIQNSILDSSSTLMMELEVAKRTKGQVPNPDPVGVLLEMRAQMSNTGQGEAVGDGLAEAKIEVGLRVVDAGWLNQILRSISLRLGIVSMMAVGVDLQPFLSDVLLERLAVSIDEQLIADVPLVVVLVEVEDLPEDRGLATGLRGCHRLSSIGLCWYSLLELGHFRF